MAELFEEKHWIGEFFINDNYEERFVGEVNYSPENGVVFSYSITSHQVPDEANIVHGILSTGEKCTLVGKFSPRQFIPTLKNGLATQHGKIGFSCIVIGDLLKNEEKFNNINFSLTGMQEFFFPKGYKDLVKYSDKPLFSINTNYGKIEIGNNAKFNFLHKDVSSQIYSRNQDAQNKLKKLFEELGEEYPSANFMLKKDIEYRIFMNIDTGLDIVSIYKHINDISNLFSILIYAPVYPDSIHILKKDEENHSVTLVVYPSMSLGNRTMDLSLKDRSHFYMPITKRNIDLEEIIKQWLNTSNDYSTIVSSIQNETGYRDEHSLHGELVLYSTQFESISYDADGKESKYEYPINEYGTDKVKNGVKRIFDRAGESDIGKGIGCLRNEIAHVGRPKKLLNKITMRDKVYLSQYMQLTILGFILNKIGIDKTVINEYQDKFTSDAE